MTKILCTILVLVGGMLQAAGITDAKGYNKNSSMQWQWAQNAMEKYEWTGQERVLDLGCGDGKITQEIAQKRTKGLVVGVDISPSMIGFASENFKAPNLLFQQLDITSMQFNKQFDLAVAFCTLHFIVEQEEGLRRIRESLVPGGHLLFVGPGLDGTSVGNISAELVATEKWKEFFPNYKKQRVYYTKEEYVALLEKMGFSPIFFNVSYDALRFADKNALITWLSGFVNYISHLTDTQKASFLEEIADKMMLYCQPTPDGTLLLQSSLFECLVSN